MQVDCLGCRTHFNHNQVVKMEGIAVQHKNYNLPIKEEKIKWTLLRAIVSFLNSRGGTIYIGVDDESGSVQGVFLSRKEMDNFQLELKRLIERIYPAVDINQKQQVAIQFVPIYQDKNFHGRYIIKIIVQAGDPSQTYCLSRKIKLEGTNSQTDQFQIHEAFYRHAFGGTQKVKGEQLLKNIYNRAKNPSNQKSVFHDNCNPQPPNPQLVVKTIVFSNINSEEKTNLFDYFKGQLEKRGCQYQIKYSKENKSISITFEDKDQFEEINDFIDQNIQFLNEEFPKVTFKPVGEVQYYYLYENVKDQTEQSKSKKQKGNQEKEEKQEKNENNNRNKKWQKQQKQLMNQAKKQHGKLPKQKQEGRQNIQKAINKKAKSNSPQINAKQNSEYCLTLTHIQPESVKQLQKILNQICNQMKKKITAYINTVQINFESQKDFMKYCEAAMKRQQQLAGYGFKQEIHLGINTGQLKIMNFDRNKLKQLEEYLRNQIGDNIVRVNTQNKGKKPVLFCKLASNSLACQWLDQLLQKKDLKKKFRIPGDWNTTPKIKIYLELG